MHQHNEGRLRVAGLRIRQREVNAKSTIMKTARVSASRERQMPMSAWSTTDNSRSGGGRSCFHSSANASIIHCLSSPVMAAVPPPPSIASIARRMRSAWL